MSKIEIQEVPSDQVSIPIKTYTLKKPDGLAVSAEDLAKRYVGKIEIDGQSIPVGYTKDGAAIGYYSGGRWWPYAVGSITGQWVQVHPDGLPLINGQRPYPDEQFIAVNP